MPTHAPTSTRVAAMAAVMFTTLAACAGSPDQNSEVPAADLCPPDSTLFCRKRMGKTYSCTCKGRDSLRDILEPYPD